MSRSARRCHCIFIHLCVFHCCAHIINKKCFNWKQRGEISTFVTWSLKKICYWYQLIWNVSQTAAADQSRLKYLFYMLMLVEQVCCSFNCRCSNERSGVNTSSHHLPHLTVCVDEELSRGEDTTTAWQITPRPVKEPLASQLINATGSNDSAHRPV